MTAIWKFRIPTTNPEKHQSSGPRQINPRTGGRYRETEVWQSVSYAVTTTTRRSRSELAARPTCSIASNAPFRCWLHNASIAAARSSDMGSRRAVAVYFVAPIVPGKAAKPNCATAANRLFQTRKFQIPKPKLQRITNHQPSNRNVSRCRNLEFGFWSFFGIW